MGQAVGGAKGAPTAGATNAPAESTPAPPPAPTRPPRTIDPFDSSGFSGPLTFPTQLNTPEPSPDAAAPPAPTVRLGQGVQGFLLPAVGTRISCSTSSLIDAVTTGTVTRVDNVTDRSFDTDRHGRDFLPSYEATVACEEKKVLGSPYGYVRESRWTETVTVGIETEHALDPSLAKGDAPPSTWVVSDTQKSGLVVQDVGARQARRDNRTAQVLTEGMRAGTAVAVPYAGGAIAQLPVTGDLYRRASEFVVDHVLGGAALRHEQVVARIRKEQETPPLESPPPKTPGR